MGAGSTVVRRFWPVPLRSLFLLSALLVACGAERAGGASEPREAAPPAEAVPPGGWRLTYRLSGGIAGFDVSFTVDGSGGARYDRRHPRPLVKVAKLEAGEIGALARQVRESGFLELESRHLPDLDVADAFTYRIGWESTETVHEVEAMDGAVLPAAFLAVREAIGALERRVLSEAAASEGDAR